MVQEARAVICNGSKFRAIPKVLKPGPHSGSVFCRARRCNREIGAGGVQWGTCKEAAQSLGT